MSEPRVVITGLGIVSALGYELRQVWASLCRGQSGIRPLHTRPEEAPWWPAIGGEVPEFDPTDFIPWERVPRLSRSTWFMIAAALMAARDGNLHRPVPPTAGISLSTALADVKEQVEKHGSFAEHCARMGVPYTPGEREDVSGEVATALQTRGPAETHTNGTGASITAIGRAFDMIRSGMARVVITGGTDVPWYIPLV